MNWCGMCGVLSDGKHVDFSRWFKRGKCLLKYTLTIQEAAQYFRIGYKKLKKLIDEHPNQEFILWNGTRAQIKQKLFEKYVDDFLSSI